MKLIVGLGNPGIEYKNSRHNVGFCVIDVLARRWSIDMTRRKHQARCGDGLIGLERVVMLKPQKYMNRSGGSVAAAVQFYKIPQENILVIVDDMALALGRLRLRAQGSAGGHNGLKDIITHLGGMGFSRLRVGIGAAPGENAVSHVLGNFSPDELDILGPALNESADAVEYWLKNDISQTMTKYNKNGS
ncbi:MAG: aminoacyl-tRNA hydrolase [Phycisphaerae bacterium]|nr:aminoacyl-tRNA hydrolase [Phycisphaerae bacterium]